MRNNTLDIKNTEQANIVASLSAAGVVILFVLMAMSCYQVGFARGQQHVYNQAVDHNCGTLNAKTLQFHWKY